MSAKIWIINIILAVGILFFGIKTHDVWFGEESQVTAPEPAQKVAPTTEKQFVKRNLPAESTYKTVVDKNIFSAERREYLPEPEPEPLPEPEVEPEPEIKPLEGLGRQITLYGVIILDDYKKALISNPSRNRREGKDKWVQAGDTVMEIKQRHAVSTLKVEEIFDDRVLISDGSSRYELLLYDKNNPKKRETVRMEEKAEVIAPSSPAASHKAPPARPTPQKRKAPPKPAKTVQGQQPSNAEYETINTPFGEIRRRKK